VTGEKLSQAGWLSSSKAGSQGSGAEAEFTSSSDGVRAPSVTRKGTERCGTMRNRFESSQVAQGGFEPESIAVTQRVKRLLLCISTGGRLWRFREAGSAKGKTLKGGTK
jgi:hypothetical protein